MKKTILAIFTFLMMAGSSFANNDPKPAKQYIESLKKEFPSATDISLQANADFEMASFKLNGTVMFAYFTREGELKAVIRNILSDELPLLLYNDLKSNYQQFWISSLYEAVNDGESHYFMILEDSEHRILMKSVNATIWIVEAKAKKPQA
jgi:hypothetical protein